MASGGLCSAGFPSCVAACLSSLDLNYVWGVLGGRTEHNHTPPPRWLGLDSRAVCGTKGIICSSELNKTRWPRLGAARPGVSSSEEQWAWGGERLFFLNVAIVYGQNKREQHPAFTRQIKALSMDNKTSTLQFWRLSSKPFMALLGGELCPMVVSPGLCAEAFCWARILVRADGRVLFLLFDSFAIV